MSSRPILGLLYTLRGLRELGENIEPVLARHGLDADHLDPSARVDRSLELQLYAELAHVVRDPLAGLKTGTFFGFTGYGPVAMLLMSCADAYEAFQLGIRYQQLTFLFSTLRFEPGLQESALALYPLPLPEPAYRFRIDGELSGTHKLIRDMQLSMGLNLHALAIELPYARPEEAAAYEAHYHCPVHFTGIGQPARIWLRNEYLKLNFPTADATSNTLFRRQCDALLEQQASNVLENMSTRVRRYLEIFTQNFPAAGDIARAFDIPERSLRRQLSQEGLSFRQLLDDVRFEKARQFLSSSRLSIEAIALKLGYAEAAAFNHAFKRWSGITPSTFRQQK